jgi:hypothetical protein
MSVPVWSVVKFKIKDGCEDEFLAAHVFRREPYEIYEIIQCN